LRFPPRANTRREFLSSLKKSAFSEPQRNEEEKKDMSHMTQQNTILSWSQLELMFSQMDDYFDIPEGLESEVKACFETIRTVLARESTHKQHHYRCITLFWNMEKKIFEHVAKRLGGVISHTEVKKFHKGEHVKCQATKIKTRPEDNQYIPWSNTYEVSNRQFHIQIKYVNFVYNHHFQEFRMQWRFRVMKQIYNPIRQEWNWNIVE
jgi:hypothetical protein